MTRPCSHGRADPRMCPDCRAQRLADAVLGERPAEPAEVDHALSLTQDMQHFMGRVGCVALTVEDATQLLRGARRSGRIDPSIVLRVSEAIAEALAAMPPMPPATANAIPPGHEDSDHGGNNSTALNMPPD